YFDDGGGTCKKVGVTVDADNGACRNQKGTFGENASISVPKAVVGSCSAVAVPSRASVSTTPRRMCVPAPSTCLDRLCAAPAAMQACLVKDGDVDCPASMPTKHVVGPDFALSCADCSCQVDATCDGTMRFYAKKGCDGSPSKTLHAGECTATKKESF